MKTIAVEGTHTADSGTGTSATLILDLSLAAAAVGDFALMIAEYSASAVALSHNRAGWTALTQINVATTLSSRVWYKGLDATDISNDTVTITGTNTRCAAGLAVFSGVDLTNPLDAVSPNPTTVSESTNDQTNPFAGIDPVAAAFVVALQANNFAAGGTKVDWPAGWTKIFGEVGAMTTLRRPGVSCATYNANPTAAAVAAGNTIPDQLAHSAAYTFALRPAPDDVVLNTSEFFPFINAV